MELTTICCQPDELGIQFARKSASKETTDTKFSMTKMTRRRRRRNTPKNRLSNFLGGLLLEIVGVTFLLGVFVMFREAPDRHQANLEKEVVVQGDLFEHGELESYVIGVLENHFGTR